VSANPRGFPADCAAQFRINSDSERADFVARPISGVLREIAVSQKAGGFPPLSVTLACKVIARCRAENGRRFPGGVLVAELRAFTKDERGGVKEGYAVSEPQSAGKKPLPVFEAERDKQPVKRANVCWCHKLCQQSARVSRRIACRNSESIPIRNARVSAKDPILLVLR